MKKQKIMKIGNINASQENNSLALETFTTLRAQ